VGSIKRQAKGSFGSISAEFSIRFRVGFDLNFGHIFASRRVTLWAKRGSPVVFSDGRLFGVTDSFVTQTEGIDDSKYLAAQHRQK
jgi:hypothetical protein